MATKGDLTRQNIIEKSMQLFSVKGYFNTSIAGIVKATGLTKGGLYGHFRNKQEIWYAVYAECVRIWKSIVFQGVRDISDPLARLERVIENSLKNYLGAGVFEGGCFLLNSLVELAGQSPTMSNHVLEGFKGFRRIVTSVAGRSRAARHVKGRPQSRRNCQFHGDRPERGCSPVCRQQRSCRLAANHGPTALLSQELEETDLVIRRTAIGRPIHVFRFSN